MQVNFKGFVPAGAGPNQGEDRGHLIDTAADLMPRYSKCSGQGIPGMECYRVEATLGGKLLGEMEVNVIPAKLDYLVLRRKDGHTQVFYNGETVRAAPAERLKVVDLKSNVNSFKELSLALDGKGSLLALSDGLIDTADKPFRDLARREAGGVRLLVLRAKQKIGFVRLTIGEP